MMKNPKWALSACLLIITASTHQASAGWTITGHYNSDNYPVSDIDDHLVINPTSFTNGKIYLVTRQSQDTGSNTCIWNLPHLTGYFPSDAYNPNNNSQRSHLSGYSSGAQAGYDSTNKNTFGWFARTNEYVPNGGGVAGNMYNAVNFRLKPADYIRPWTDPDAQVIMKTQIAIPSTNLTGDQVVHSKFETFIVDTSLSPNKGFWYQDKFYNQGTNTVYNDKIHFDLGTQNYIVVAKHTAASSYHTVHSGSYKNGPFNSTRFTITISLSELQKMVSDLNNAIGSTIFSSNWGSYEIRGLNVNTEMVVDYNKDGYIENHRYVAAKVDDVILQTRTPN